MDEVGLAELNRVLLAEERAGLIDFWGPWCSPCRTLRPHLEQLADDHRDGWRFVAVNADEHPEVAQRYGVASTPTLVFVRGGDEVHRFTGATTPSRIAEALGTY